jgi:hypothetical protein
MFQMQQQQQQGQDDGGFMGATPQPRPGQGTAGQGSTAFKGKAYKLGGS